MSRITVKLSDEWITELSRKADLLGISKEELIRLSIGEMVEQPDEEFSQAAEYILKKNAELYKRLS